VRPDRAKRKIHDRDPPLTCRYNPPPSGYMPAALARETANALNRLIRRAIAPTLPPTSLHQIVMNEHGHDKTPNRSKPRFHGPSRNTARQPRTTSSQKHVVALPEYGVDRRGDLRGVVAAGKRVPIDLGARLAGAGIGLNEGGAEGHGSVGVIGEIHLEDELALHHIGIDLAGMYIGDDIDTGRALCDVGGQLSDEDVER
jgi:hypothetical protein